MQIRVDEKVLWKYVLCCLNNENCCLNLTTKQALKFSLLFLVNWAVKYMHKNWGAMVLSKLFFLFPPSGHIISLFSPTFSHNFSNIIADIHLSPHVDIHISQINGDICYIAWFKETTSLVSTSLKLVRNIPSQAYEAQVQWSWHGQVIHVELEFHKA